MNTVTSPATLPAGTWTLDATHSNVGFSVHWVVGSFRSGFTSFDATLVGSDGDVRLEGTVDVESLTIANESFREHLLGEEFFDIAAHPQLRFAATGLRRDGDRVSLDGELTIRGVTHPVAVAGTLTGPAPHPFHGEAVGLALEAVVDRTAFGLGWNMEIPGAGNALADEVVIHVDLQLVPPH